MKIDSETKTRLYDVVLEYSRNSSGIIIVLTINIILFFMLYKKDELANYIHLIFWILLITFVTMFIAGINVKNFTTKYFKILNPPIELPKASKKGTQIRERKKNKYPLFSLIGSIIAMVFPMIIFLTSLISALAFLQRK